MKRALGVMGLAAGLLLGTGTARAHHPEGVRCVRPVEPVAQGSQSAEDSIDSEDWHGLYEYQMSGEPASAADQSTAGPYQMTAQMGPTRKVAGEVARVNLILGEVGIFANGQFVTLHATPAQLVLIKPGTFVQLDYIDRGGVLQVVQP